MQCILKNLLRVDLMLSVPTTELKNDKENRNLNTVLCIYTYVCKLNENLRLMCIQFQCCNKEIFLEIEDSDGCTGV